MAEWAVAATCAAIAVAWLVKELLMGVCKIEKRLDGKVVIITGELTWVVTNQFDGFSILFPP